MAEPQFYGDRLPTRSKTPLPDIIAQKGPKPLTVTCLGHTMCGVWQHFADMSLPHVPEGHCWACDTLKQTPRWQGYLAVYDEVQKDNRVLTFPEGTGRLLLALLVEHGSLRGLRLKLYRRDHERPKSPLLVSVVERLPTDRLRAEFDPRPSVDKLLRVNEGYYNSESYRHKERPARIVKSVVEMPTGFVNPLTLFTPKGIE